MMRLPSSELVAPFLRALSITARQRFATGAKRPGWSFAFEWMVESLRQTAKRLSVRPIESARASWEKTAAIDPAMDAVVSQPTSVAYVSGEWFRPRGTPRPGGPTLLYLHGGGYCIGSTHTHAGLIARLTLAHGGQTLAVNYRLAPEHKFPAALDDALSAYRGLLESGIPSDQLFIGGDSAGGGLTLATMLRLRDLGLPLPKAGLLLCPWVDLMDTGGSVQRNAPYDWMDPSAPPLWAGYYLQKGQDPKDPLASPLYADLTGLPPLMIQVGTAELLYDQIIKLADRARSQGVSVELEQAPDMIHNWHVLAPFFPHCQAAIERLASYIRAQR